MANIKHGILSAIATIGLLAAFASLAFSNSVSPNGAYGGGGTPAPTCAPAATAVLNTTVSHGAPGGATSTAVAVPSGTKAGDRLFLAMDSGSACSAGTLPAWINMVQMANAGNNGGSPGSAFQQSTLSGFFGAFTKVASAADASSGTYTLSGCGAIYHYVMVDVTRSDGVTPSIDQLQEQADSATTSPVGVTTTTLGANEAILTIVDHTTTNVQCTSTNNTGLYNGGSSESTAASYNVVASVGGTSTGATFTCGDSHNTFLWTVGFF